MGITSPLGYSTIGAYDSGSGNRRGESYEAFSIAHSAVDINLVWSRSFAREASAVFIDDTYRLSAATTFVEAWTSHMTGTVLGTPSMVQQVVDDGVKGCAMGGPPNRC